MSMRAGKRPQYKTLTSNTWDILIIMLGTNDAKDPGDGGPNNWLQYEPICLVLDIRILAEGQ